MASSNRKITGLLGEDNQDPKPVATQEQMEQVHKLVNNLFARYEITGDDSLLFAAKYFHNPERAEIQSLLTDESAAAMDQLASYDYYQNSMEHTFFPKAVAETSEIKVDADPVAYVALPSSAPTAKP
jgi:hypothetical protein